MERAQRKERYLLEAPKVELHVHLEGTIRPETLLILAKRNKVTLPVTTVEEAREWFKFRNFPHFVEIYFAISRCLKTADDYELIAYEFGAEMARQNVRSISRLIPSTTSCSTASGTVSCPPNRSEKWRRRFNSI